MRNLLEKQRLANYAMVQFVRDAQAEYEKALKEELRWRVDGPELSLLDILRVYYV